MKKIITALTVTALAIGSVFAQVGVEYTQKAFLYSPNGNKMELAGYDGNDGNIKFQVKNSNAGAWLTIKAQLGTAEKYDGSGSYNETYENTKKNDHGPELSEYVGWVKFGGGLFKLQSGTFDQRAANRFTGLAGKWQGSLYERYKLGVLGGTVGTDIDNIAIGYYKAEGSTGDVKSCGKVLTSFIEYSGEVATVRAAINHNEDGYGTLDLKSGFSFQAIANVGEGTKLVADFKTPKNNELGFGFFAENTSLKENLDFLVGFTFAQTTQNNTKLSGSVKNIEVGVDLRAKYKLGDNLGITTMNNLSYIGKDKKFNLWDMVSLDMPISEKFTGMFTVEWEYKDLFHETAPTSTYGYGELDLVPSIKYTPVKGVDLTAGLIIATYGWSRPDTTKFSVPVLLHVSL